MIMGSVNEEEIDRRVLDAQWKTEVDSKLDMLVAFATKYEDYLKLAFDAQMRRKAMRDAIIEKSLVALIIAAIAASATGLWTYAKAMLKAG